MTILTRISRLFKADMHGILDNLEEPKVILKQAIRDMQEEIDKADAAIAILTQQQERLQQKKQALSRHIEELQRDLEFCLGENNETLAKSVIRKKLQAEWSLKQLSTQLSEIGAEKDKKIAETEDRKEKLQAICDKWVLFDESSEFDDRTAETPAPVSRDDVELAFLYEKQRHAQKPANGEPS
ncbi:MAG: PspA/IM30 family protein [Gammaproteobacteria bacterium]